MEQIRRTITTELNYGFATVLKVRLNILCWIGMRPPNCLLKNPKYIVAYNAYRTILASIVIFVFTTCLAHLFRARNDLVAMGDNLCLVFGMVLILFKFVVFWFKFEDVQEIVGDLEVISKGRTMSYYQIQERYVTANLKTEVFFFVLCSCLFIFFVALAPDEGCLPFKAWFPFDLKDSKTFKAMYAFQTVTLMHLLVSIMMMDTVCGECWHFIGMQLYVLSGEFDGFENYCLGEYKKSGRYGEFPKEKLRNLIMQHQFLVGMATKMNSITSPLLAAQIFSSNFIICLTGFETTWTYYDINVFLKFVLYLIASLVQQGYFCILGNHVQVMSSSIALTAVPKYKIRMNRSDMRTLEMIILRAQRSVVMNATTVKVLNLKEFLLILRRSYSYFTLLRSLSE